MVKGSLKCFGIVYTQYQHIYTLYLQHNNYNTGHGGDSITKSTLALMATSIEHPMTVDIDAIGKSDSNDCDQVDEATIICNCCISLTLDMIPSISEGNLSSSEAPSSNT